MATKSVRLAVGFVVVFAMLASACGGSSDDEATAAANEPASTAATATDTGADEPSVTTEEGAAESVEAAPTAVPEQLTSPDEGDQGEDSSTIDDGPVYGGELIYGIASDGTGFNTTDAINEGSFRIISALNDPLIAVNRAGDWVPHLAESLTSNDDFTQWTMTLRPDLTFHDGEPVDAEAVKANMDAFKAGPNVGFAVALVDEVTVTGPLELQMQLSAPWAAYPYTLAGQPGYVVSPSTIGQNDTFVGVGPFILETWNPADSARVVRNDNYWRPDGAWPYLDAITFKVIPEQSARLAALQAGDVDAINGPADNDILDFLEDPEIDVYISEAPSNEGLLLLNTTTAPTDDLRIRQAMAHAIDRQLIVDTFRSGLTIPANSFISPTSDWFVETDYPTYDPDTATALVAEYEAEVGPATLEILGRNSTSTLEVADLVKAFFDEVGIETTVTPIAPGTEVLPVIQDNFQSIMWAQFGSPDPDGAYIFFHSSGGALNWSNLVSDKMDEGFDIGRASDDFDTRKQGYAMVQEVFAEEVPMLWFDHFSGIEAAAALPYVHGIPDGFLVDGSEHFGLVNGSYFSWEDVWMDADRG